MQIQFNIGSIGGESEAGTVCTGFDGGIDGLCGRQRRHGHQFPAGIAQQLAIGSDSLQFDLR